MENGNKVPYSDGFIPLNHSAVALDAFEQILQWVTASPETNSSRILSLVTAAVLNSDFFDLRDIERLEQTNQALWWRFFDGCMVDGLSEEVRLYMSGAIAPYADMHNAVIRH